MKASIRPYTISDYIGWSKNGELLINSNYQRRTVWSNTARVYLIDTILRELSLPKFYIRTKVDLRTTKTVREVVDGQQRLRAILGFFQGEYKLTKIAGEFSGLTYETLPEDLQEKFLKFELATDVLENASDEKVLEVFARLNSYNVTLNAAEKRHAEYQGEFKWMVFYASNKLGWLWEKYPIVDVQRRLRMGDDSMVAELMGILLNGLGAGGEVQITKLYKQYDAEVPNKSKLESNFFKVIQLMDEKFGGFLKGALGRRPQFTILFAAIAHSLYGLNEASLGQDLPPRRPINYKDATYDRLAQLSSILEEPEDSEFVPLSLRKFVSASKSTTQAVSGRKVRFDTIYAAITDD